MFDLCCVSDKMEKHPYFQGCYLDMMIYLFKFVSISENKNNRIHFKIYNEYRIAYLTRNY
jgi:hypothetical protein